MTEAEPRVRAAFATQAEWCARLGAPFTSLLCRLLGARLDARTGLGRRLLGWQGEPIADALPLRLCGGLHALVRKGAAPDLAACYPPHALLEGDALWRQLRPVLDDPFLPAWLDSAPQTNEVGRAAVLMSGLLAVASRFGQPVELLELGASAGLNLLVDRYRHDLGGRKAGDPASPLRLEPDWQGPPPPDAAVTVAARRGVDINPLDPRRDGARLIAYVWPEQAARLARLEAALAIAATEPPQVDRADAADWLEARLAAAQTEGVTRIVFHSVAIYYFPAESQTRIAAAMERAGAAATEERPLAWLRYEPEPDDSRFTLRLKSWPGGEDRLLAACHPHGASVAWLAG